MGAAILYLSLIETEKGSAKLPKQSRCKNIGVILGKLVSLRNIQN